MEAAKTICFGLQNSNMFQLTCSLIFLDTFGFKSPFFQGKRGVPWPFARWAYGTLSSGRTSTITFGQPQEEKTTGCNSTLKKTDRSVKKKCIKCAQLEDVFFSKLKQRCWSGLFMVCQSTLGRSLVKQWHHQRLRKMDRGWWSGSAAQTCGTTWSRIAQAADVFWRSRSKATVVSYDISIYTKGKDTEFSTCKKTKGEGKLQLFGIRRMRFLCFRELMLETSRRRRS